jgi:hypothetical protein
VFTPAMGQCSILHSFVFFWEIETENLQVGMSHVD